MWVKNDFVVEGMDGVGLGEQSAASRRVVMSRLREKGGLGGEVRKRESFGVDGRST